MPDEPRELSENWREEWLAEDRAARKEDWRDVVREGGRFWWWWEKQRLVGAVLFAAFLALLILVGIIAGVR